MWFSFRKNKTWNNKKIAFVSILTATSVALIVVFNSIMPLTSVPSFKLIAGGLPIKITGYIFGPLVGAMTGIISDLISFAFRPTFIHWWYTLAFALAGAIPGIVGWFMFRRWKNKSSMPAKDEVKYNNINFVIALVVLSAVIASLTTFLMLQGDEIFQGEKILIKNKFIFMAIALTGSSTMLIAVIVFRFVLKPKTFNSFLPIIVFSAILEVCVTPLITLGDISSFEQNKEAFVSILTGHLLLSPIKIWGNLLVVYFSYKVVSPLIFNKTDNGWERGK